MKSAIFPFFVAALPSLSISCSDGSSEYADTSPSPAVAAGVEMLSAAMGTGLTAANSTR